MINDEGPGAIRNSLSSEQYYDQIAQEYSRITMARREYLDAVDDLVKEAVGEVPRDEVHPRLLLDIGCGDGRRTGALSRDTGVSIVGLESSAKMIRVAKLQGLPLVCASIESAPFREGEFDGALMLWNVLGHVTDPLGALSSIRRLVAPGGLLLMDVNNRYNVRQYGLGAVARNIFQDHLSGRVRHERKFVIDLPGQGVHEVRIFTPSEIMHLVTSAGFRVTARAYVDYESGRLRRFAISGQIFLKCVAA